ncbi:unnamed protein product [Heterotrigona itama]|uniref:Uncharacterized protein n=1 Tax=Heterotrigona itama TaxID=395501 RepID=A0A6V7H2G3_9HYME|nr:unnamed protein product [Heterotrigona itama]
MVTSVALMGHDIYNQLSENTNSREPLATCAEEAHHRSLIFRPVTKRRLALSSGVPAWKNAGRHKSGQFSVAWLFFVRKRRSSCHGLHGSAMGFPPQKAGIFWWVSSRTRSKTSGNVTTKEILDFGRANERKDRRPIDEREIVSAAMPRHSISCEKGQTIAERESMAERYRDKGFGWKVRRPVCRGGEEKKPKNLL